MSWFGLLSALLMPWVCGTLWATCLLGKTGRHNWPLLCGHGFFIGYFLVSLVIRAWDAVGLELRFVPILSLLVVVSFIGLGVLLRFGNYVRPERAGEKLSVLARVGVATLLCLIAWRYLVLGQELLLRPLYGWDSWMNWAPKAVVWFHHGSMVDFVSPQMWLSEASVNTYTLGNAAAWDYPVTVPLIQLWAMLGAGSWDHPAVYLPWLMAPLFLALLVYGHLRLAGAGVLLAVGACYLLLSMPFTNVHSVLAGYADLWLGAAFAAAVCSLYELRRKLNIPYLLLCLILAAMCAQLKVPGMFLGLIVVVFVVRTVLNLAVWKELLAATGLLLFFIAIMSIGLAFKLPHVGEVILSWDEMRLDPGGSFKLEYHPVEGAFIESYFKMINWHLFFYLCIALIFVTKIYGSWKRSPGSEFLATLAGFLFITVVFMFSGYHSQATNFVALNRSLLHIVPAAMFVCCLSVSVLFNGAVRASHEPD